MSRAEVLDLYRERLSQREREKERRRRDATLVSWARLAVFAAGVALLWFVWEVRRDLWPLLLVPAAIFAALLLLHLRLRDLLTRAERAERFYRSGIDRLTEAWRGTGRSGEAFADRDHPYARDLDVFGKGSLFELLATTVSPWGTSTLAEWLKQPASREVVRSRQEAVLELRPLLELREEAATELTEEPRIGDQGALVGWAESPRLLGPGAGRWAALLIGLATASLGVLWIAGRVDRAVFLAAVAVASSFAMFFWSRARRVLAAAEAPVRDLSVVAALLEILEHEGFTSSLLVALEGRLGSEGEPASKRIRRLARLIELLDARRNQLFAPLGALLLWGTQFAFALEAWRARSGPAVRGWLEAVGELDALLALSGYSFENPDDPFPEVTGDAARFEAEGLGHPLIPLERLVRNDVELGGELRLVVVSGSNMSGKSTLLRAVGVNTVLALAGAPVRARRLTLSVLQTAASIRIEDSLQDGISHFYAEILRLRQIMELAGGERAVVFLLDEILHGTNSHDRRIGAEAVVRGLVDRGAIGLITTHDLALSRLAETLVGKAINVHFEDQIVDGRVQFDYRMREGVVKKSNALELMRAVGLEV